MLAYKYSGISLNGLLPCGLWSYDFILEWKSCFFFLFDLDVAKPGSVFDLLRLFVGF